MKILIVTNMYPSEGDVSWRGSFVKEQVEAHKRLYPNDIVDIFHIKGRISGSTNINYISTFPALIRRLLFGGYDVVHCHHAFCVLLCIPWFFRLTYTVHEGELNNTSWRSWLIKMAVWLSKSPIYVSNDEFLKSKSKRKKFLPCGVDFSVFRPSVDKSLLKKTLRIDANRILILFPADPRRKEKNGNVMKDVEAISIKAKKDWIYVYGGTIAKNDMPLWMAASDVVLSIGKYESDGMVIKEAMACNTPVIATKVGNAHLYVNSKTGVIVNADPYEIFNAINKITANSSELNDGRKTMKLLRQDIFSTAKRLQDIYTESAFDK